MNGAGFLNNVMEIALIISVNILSLDNAQGMPKLLCHKIINVL